MTGPRPARSVPALLAMVLLSCTACGMIVTTDPPPIQPPPGSKGNGSPAGGGIVVDTTTSTTRPDDGLPPLRPPRTTVPQGTPGTGTIFPRTDDESSKQLYPVAPAYRQACDAASVLGAFYNGFANGPIPDVSYLMDRIIKDLEASKGLVPSNRKASYESFLTSARAARRDVANAASTPEAVDILRTKYASLVTSPSARDLTVWIEQVCKPTATGTGG